MKKLIVLFIITCISCVTVFAESAFIKVRICPYFESASSSSAKIGILRHNTEVTVLEKSNDWTKVKIGNASGYVQNIFIGAEPGIQVSSITNNRSNIASIEVRKRASNFTSSAAAIRGLSDENVRDRENLSFKEYDFESIKWIESNFSYTEEDLIAFSESEFIRL